MNPISQICPVTDAEAARLVQDDTMAALGDDIVRSGYRRRCPPAGRGLSRRLQRAGRGRVAAAAAHRRARAP